MTILICLLIYIFLCGFLFEYYDLYEEDTGNWIINSIFIPIYILVFIAKMGAYLAQLVRGKKDSEKDFEDGIGY